MGSHISKVKSIGLDTWSAEQIDVGAVHDCRLIS